MLCKKSNSSYNVPAFPHEYLIDSAKSSVLVLKNSVNFVRSTMVIVTSFDINLEELAA